MFNANLYNPDILTCLANLSNDEVFTPPQVANDILDLLPAHLWRNRNARFLDPVCKSGVFLREITKRLMFGLADEIPDPQQRANHILKNQVFGMAITELTALLSRRSVYCSKTANGKYSIGDGFGDSQGNIRFGRMEHTWQNGHCTYCGASQEVFDRGNELESHAYAFIHTDTLEENFKMKFDVIVGNPPYQLKTSGPQTQATPLYHMFIQRAKKLSPRYLTMIVPARWYSGGMGLDAFRSEMLNDRCIREIVDFPEAIDVFPGVQIKGGVCYFLWDRDHPGDCHVTTIRKGEVVSEMVRPLLEDDFETFIRYNEAIPILKKVRKFEEKSLMEQISSMKPFGLPTHFKGEERLPDNGVVLYQNGGIGFVKRSTIPKNHGLIDRHKVLIARAGSGSDAFPHTILGKPFAVPPGSACTETYIVLGDYDTEEECRNLCTYVTTRLFRFLVLLNKPTQDALRKVYQFVPVQDFSEPWTDEKLYTKYGITEEETAFIESMVRPMELDNG